MVFGFSRYARLDNPGKECGALDEFWDKIGEHYSRGSVWRARCAAGAPQSGVCQQLGDVSEPLFMAWDGDVWQRYGGAPKLETLFTWVGDGVAGLLGGDKAYRKLTLKHQTDKVKRSMKVGSKVSISLQTAF